MEKWDLYDKNGVLLNKVHIRGDRLLQGEFHLVVAIWIINSNGDFLIQKRAKPLAGYSDVWSCTAGAVLSGETSCGAAIRETYEEMGLIFHEHQMNFKDRKVLEDFILDVWLVEWNGKLSEVDYDKVEVLDVKWVDNIQLKEMFLNQEFFTYETNYINKLILSG